MTWTRCPEIQTLAVWGKNVVLRCVNVRQMMPMVWKHWHPYMRSRAPERGLLRRQGVQPDLDASCWPCLMCVCALIKGKIFSLTAHHFYVFFRDGKIPLNSGNGSNLWYRSNKPRKLWAFESHTELQQKLLRLAVSLQFLWEEEKTRQAIDDFTSCHIGVPPPWGLHRSAKLRFRCSVYIVYSTMNSSPSLLPETDERWWIIFELVPVSPYLYSIRTNVMFR